MNTGFLFLLAIKIIGIILLLLSSHPLMVTVTEMVQSIKGVTRWQTILGSGQADVVGADLALAHPYVMALAQSHGNV